MAGLIGTSIPAFLATPFDVLKNKVQFNLEGPGTFARAMKECIPKGVMADLAGEVKIHSFILI